MKDQYISVLGETVVKLETVYGMKNAVDGTRISDMSMRDIVQYYNEVIRTQSKEALVALNAKAGRELAILSYVSQRMTYFNKKRLDFSHYPNMKTVANVLIGFTNYKKISERTIRNINKIISLLVVSSVPFSKKRVVKSGYKLYPNSLIALAHCITVAWSYKY